MFLNKTFIGDCPLFFNKTFIGDYPLFLNKTVYRRLSNAFQIKPVIRDCPLFLNKTKCCIGVQRPAMRTRKYVAHKCITHSTG